MPRCARLYLKIRESRARERNLLFLLLLTAIVAVVAVVLLLLLWRLHSRYIAVTPPCRSPPSFSLSRGGGCFFLGGFVCNCFWNNGDDPGGHAHIDQKDIDLSMMMFVKDFIH